VKDADERALLRGRTMVVRRLKALPIEAVVRGYLLLSLKSALRFISWKMRKAVMASVIR
jgi:phosphoribosylaminoimidazole-succinocarboxamide synthase